ncbi:MAG: transglycosylase SLT domain-containing protein [Rhodobacteraceae bacterium]|nr:transglycosylase SLT domain-containing protein [Paracoccaceae bacterium]
MLAGAVFGALSAFPASAESPPPFPEFSARRIAAPPPGQVGRINVQVTPQDFAAQEAPPLLSVAPAPSETVRLRQLPPDVNRPGPRPVESAFDWYWNGVSPDISAANSARLDIAVAGLGATPIGRLTVPVPPYEHMRRIATNHGRDIERATENTKVSPALVLAVMGVESAGRVDAVSNKGATGLMQLMPATAERFGVTDISDPAQNIQGGVNFLDWLLDEFGRDPLLILAAYNAGENSILKHGGVPPYAETRDYIPKVLAAWTVARDLCRTPPRTFMDACEFNQSGYALND